MRYLLFWVVTLLVNVTLASAEDRVLFSFVEPDAAEAWFVVNDGVMGGVSEGQFAINERHHLEFYGVLSMENNGGFASVRAEADHVAMVAGESVLLRVRGDGRVYNFNLYARRDLEGYSFRQSLETVKDEWIEVVLPLNDFVATWRGRVFPDVELDPTKVAGVGILLGDKTPGDFQLEIEWIKALGASEATPE